MAFENRKFNPDARQYFSADTAEIAALLQISPGWANRQMSKGLDHVQAVLATARAARSEHDYTESTIRELPEEWLVTIFDLVPMPD